MLHRKTKGETFPEQSQKLLSFESRMYLIGAQKEVGRKERRDDELPKRLHVNEHLDRRDTSHPDTSARHLLLTLNCWCSHFLFQTHTIDRKLVKGLQDFMSPLQDIARREQSSEKKTEFSPDICSYSLTTLKSNCSTHCISWSTTYKWFCSLVAWRKRKIAHSRIWQKKGT